MSNISPDGAWRWDGRQWVPNVAPSPAQPAYASGHGWGGAQTGAGPQPNGTYTGHYAGQPMQGAWPPSAPPRPLTPSEELTAASWSHYGPLIALVVASVLVLSVVGWGLAWLGMFAFAIPLIIRQVQGSRSYFVKAHATESLNFQLTWLLISFVAVAVTAIPAILTLGLLYVLLVPVWIGFSIFMIVVMAKAGNAAKAGMPYRYPLSFRFVPGA